MPIAPPLPEGVVDLRRPAALLATWFGVGRLPGMPGTWGSLAALPFAWAIAALLGPPALLAAAAAAFVAGCRASAEVARASGLEDPGFIVIDEVASLWLALAAAPLDWRGYAAGFVLFRIFDITKPWPARAVERRLKGGLGIMLDDIVAAVYAVAALLVCERVLVV